MVVCLQIIWHVQGGIKTRTIYNKVLILLKLSHHLSHSPRFFHFLKASWKSYSKSFFFSFLFIKGDIQCFTHTSNQYLVPQMLAYPLKTSSSNTHPNHANPTGLPLTHYFVRAIECDHLCIAPISSNLQQELRGEEEVTGGPISVSYTHLHKGWDRMGPI